MYEYFLFDFDGTLADSSECSVIATRGAFEALGLEAPSPELIVHFMGIPIETSFREMGAAHLSEEQFLELLKRFREIYKEAGDHHISAFPGGVEFLRHLKATGKKTAIITSKKTDVAQRNAQSIGIVDFIDVFVGSDSVQHYKPHPQGIEIALVKFEEKYSGKNNVIMIGDATTDIMMGRSAGVSTCAVTWGAHSREALVTSNPDYLVDDFASMRNVLKV
jgi:phosphoglycolate phosphatase